MNKYFKVYGIIGLVCYFALLITLTIFVIINPHFFQVLDWLNIVFFILFGPAIYFLFIDHARIMKKVDADKEDDVETKKKKVLKINNENIMVGTEVILKYDCYSLNGVLIPKNSVGIVKKISDSYLKVQFTINRKTYVLMELVSYFCKKI